METPSSSSPIPNFWICIAEVIGIGMIVWMSRSYPTWCLICLNDPKWTGDLLVIVEYCRFGNLQNFMIRNRKRFIHQVNERGYLDSSIGADVLNATSSQWVLLALMRPNEWCAWLVSHSTNNGFDEGSLNLKAHWECFPPAMITTYQSTVRLAAPTRVTCPCLRQVQAMSSWLDTGVFVKVFLNDWMCVCVCRRWNRWERFGFGYEWSTDIDLFDDVIGAVATVAAELSRRWAR